MTPRCLLYIDDVDDSLERRSPLVSGMIDNRLFESTQQIVPNDVVH